MAVGGGIVAGRYRLQRIVGAGGMGRVWLARDEVLARDVAVKEIVPIAGGPDLWALTVREARTAARLTHPNVVRIYDVLFTDGRPWIVMELVVGRSLATAVQQDGPLAPPDAARIGLAVLDGLDAAHRAGVLHRDVKPHNVLLADDGRILLGDFGVAVFDSGGGAAVREDVLLGSPNYIAPERVSEGVSTVRTDLWSFGATLYWSVEGRPPYARDSVAAQLVALATEAPDPQSRSGALRPVIDGLLRRDPVERLSATAARELLDRAARGAEARIRGIAPVPAATTVTEAADRKPLVAGLAIAALLAAGLGTVAIARPDSGAAFATTVASPSLRCAATPYPSTSQPGTPVRGGDGPTALPPGWPWLVDDGFRTGVPRSWSRSTNDGTVCLVDPTGRRALTVDRAAGPDRDPVASWQRAEASLLAGAAPAGYRRIVIGPALYRQGAADWEYTYEARGVRWHVQRRAFAIGADRAFVVSWTTTDDAWDVNQPNFRTVMQSFDAH